VSLTCVRSCVRHSEHLAGCPCADPQHEHGTYVVPADRIPGYGPDWPADVEGLKVACGCNGCLPKLAAPGLAVCPGCEHAARAALTELPDLWVDLAERPRLAGVTAAPDGTDHAPEAIGSDHRQERSAIKAMLVDWCLTLADDGTAHLPDEHAIARTTRDIAAWESDLARQCRDAANLLRMPTIGPLVRDPEGAAALAREETRHAHAAAAARDDRETGRDILRAICEHISRHLGTLLAGEHADQLVADLKNAHHSARGKANKARGSNLRILCSCGERVPVDDTEIMRCRGCGESGVLSWWVAREAPTDSPPLRLSALPEYLLGKGVIATARQVRDWADDGDITPTEGGGAGRRRLYDPAAVLIVARRKEATRGPRRTTTRTA
jgi:hypothetical protein